MNVGADKAACPVPSVHDIIGWHPDYTNGWTADDLLSWLSGRRLSLESAWWDDVAGFTVTLDENGHHVGAWEGSSLLGALEAAVRARPWTSDITDCSGLA